MVEVRPAAEADLEAVTEIYNALMATTTYEWTETPHTVTERQGWLEAQRRRGYPALVAVDAQQVVGWATYDDFRDNSRWPGYRFVVEHSIHVAESHWRRGAGRALMTALVDHARTGGKRVMVAAIDGSNVGSVDFHAGLGFREVGRLPGIGEKLGRRLDLVLMQLDLVEPAG